MHNIAWVFVCLVFVYALVVAGLYVFQRKLIYPSYAGGIILNVADAYTPFENFDVTTKDGIALRGWWQKAQPGKPTIVYFHGNADNLEKTATYHKLLTDQGFGLLLTSYRGYSGHKGQPTEEGLYTDASAFIDALIAQGVKQEDIIIYGFSLGTGVATEMATRFPNARALVLGAPFTSLADAAGGRYWFVPVAPLMHDKYDNLAKVKKLGMPILIVNGKNDHVFSANLGKRLSEAADPKRITFEQFEGDHESFFFDYGGDQAIARWLSKFVTPQ